MASGAGGLGRGGGKIRTRTIHKGLIKPYMQGRPRHGGMLRRLTESIRNIVPGWLQRYCNTNEDVLGCSADTGEVPRGQENREDERLTQATEESSSTSDGRITPAPTVDNTEEPSTTSSASSHADVSTRPSLHQSHLRFSMLESPALYRRSTVSLALPIGGSGFSFVKKNQHDDNSSTTSDFSSRASDKDIAAAKYPSVPPLCSIEPEASPAAPQHIATSSKNPAFNLSAFETYSSSLGNSSILQTNQFGDSPFYPGKTTYGAASAPAGWSQLQSTPYQAPVRRQMKAKKLNAQSLGVTSLAARRILQSLEKMSSPLQDAKKIPFAVSSAVNYLDRSDICSTDFQAKKIKLDSQYPPVKGPLIPKPVSIATNHAVHFKPSVILTHKLRKTYQRIADNYKNNTQYEKSVTPGQNRQQESGFPCPNFSPPTASELSSGIGNGGSKTRQDRTHFAATKLPEEKGMKVPVLSKISPPITSSSLAACSSSSSGTTLSPPSPISSSQPLPNKEKMTSPSRTSSPEIRGSSPVVKLTETDIQSPPSSVPATQAVTSDTTSTSEPVINTSAQNITSVSNTSCKKKPDEVCEGLFSQAKPVKEGNVLDFVENTGFISPKVDPFPAQHTTTSQVVDTKPAISRFTPSAIGLGESLKGQSSRRRKTCLLRNKVPEKCLVCEAAKLPSRGAAKQTGSGISNINGKPTVSASGSGFGHKCNPAVGTWDCDTCLVHNKPEALRCVACDTVKPGIGVKWFLTWPVNSSSPEVRVSSVVVKVTEADIQTPPSSVPATKAEISDTTSTSDAVINTSAQNITSVSNTNCKKKPDEVCEGLFSQAKSVKEGNVLDFVENPGIISQKVDPFAAQHTTTSQVVDTKPATSSFTPSVIGLGESLKGQSTRRRKACLLRTSEVVPTKRARGSFTPSVIGLGKSLKVQSSRRRKACLLRTSEVVPTKRARRSFTPSVIGLGESLKGQTTRRRKTCLLRTSQVVDTKPTISSFTPSVIGLGESLKGQTSRRRKTCLLRTSQVVDTKPTISSFTPSVVGLGESLKGQSSRRRKTRLLRTSQVVDTKPTISSFTPSVIGLGESLKGQTSRRRKTCLLRTSQVVDTKPTISSFTPSVVGLGESLKGQSSRRRKTRLLRTSQVVDTKPAIGSFTPSVIGLGESLKGQSSRHANKEQMTFPSSTSSPEFRGSSPVVKVTEADIQSPPSSVPAAKAEISDTTSTSDPVINTSAQNINSVNNTSCKKKPDEVCEGLFSQVKSVKVGNVLDFVENTGFTSPKVDPFPAQHTMTGQVVDTKPAIGSFTPSAIGLEESLKGQSSRRRKTCLLRNKVPEKCLVCEAAKLPSRGAAKQTGSGTSNINGKPTVSASGSGFGHKCNPAVGTWDCDTCLVHNKPEALRCVACDTVKPGIGVKWFLTWPVNSSSPEVRVSSVVVKVTEADIQSPPSSVPATKAEISDTTSTSDAVINTSAQNITSVSNTSCKKKPDEVCEGLFSQAKSVKEGNVLDFVENTGFISPKVDPFPAQHTTTSQVVDTEPATSSFTPSVIGLGVSLKGQSSRRRKSCLLRTSQVVDTKPAIGSFTPSVIGLGQSLKGQSSRHTNKEQMTSASRTSSPEFRGSSPVVKVTEADIQSPPSSVPATKAEISDTTSTSDPVINTSDQNITSEQNITSQVVDTKPAIGSFTPSVIGLEESLKGQSSRRRKTCLLRNKVPEKCLVCEAAKLPSRGAAKQTGSGTSNINGKPTVSASGSGFGHKCNPAVGTWDCDTCLVHNKPEALRCVACDTVKPGIGVKWFLTWPVNSSSPEVRVSSVVVKVTEADIQSPPSSVPATKAEISDTTSTSDAVINTSAQNITSVSNTNCKKKPDEVCEGLFSQAKSVKEGNVLDFVENTGFISPKVDPFPAQHTTTSQVVDTKPATSSLTPSVIGLGESLKGQSSRRRKTCLLRTSQVVDTKPATSSFTPSVIGLGESLKGQSSRHTNKEQMTSASSTSSPEFQGSSPVVKVTEAGIQSPPSSVPATKAEISDTTSTSDPVINTSAQNINSVSNTSCKKKPDEVCEGLFSQVKSVKEGNVLDFVENTGFISPKVDPFPAQHTTTSQVVDTKPATSSLTPNVIGLGESLKGQSSRRRKTCLLRTSQVVDTKPAIGSFTPSVIGLGESLKGQSSRRRKTCLLRTSQVVDTKPAIGSFTPSVIGLGQSLKGQSSQHTNKEQMTFPSSTSSPEFRGSSPVVKVTEADIQSPPSSVPAAKAENSDTTSTSDAVINTSAQNITSVSNTSCKKKPDEVCEGLFSQAKSVKEGNVLDFVENTGFISPKVDPFPAQHTTTSQVVDTKPATSSLTPSVIGLGESLKGQSSRRRKTCLLRTSQVVDTKPAISSFTPSVIGLGQSLKGQSSRHTNKEQMTFPSSTSSPEFRGSSLVVKVTEAGIQSPPSSVPAAKAEISDTTSTSDAVINTSAQNITSVSNTSCKKKPDEVCEGLFSQAKSVKEGNVLDFVENTGFISPKVDPFPAQQTTTSQVVDTKPATSSLTPSVIGLGESLKGQSSRRRKSCLLRTSQVVDTKPAIGSFTPSVIGLGQSLKGQSSRHTNKEQMTFPSSTSSPEFQGSSPVVKVTEADIQSPPSSVPATKAEISDTTSTSDPVINTSAQNINSVSNTSCKKKPDEVCEGLFSQVKSVKEGNVLDFVENTGFISPKVDPFPAQHTTTSQVVDTKPATSSLTPNVIGLGESLKGQSSRRRKTCKVPEKCLVCEAAKLPSRGAAKQKCLVCEVTKMLNRLDL
ncbi:uncharacterized protein LOC143677519 [Tamandua tetradactyla]|uniref:uncharacterized protein LOC143677519 n=1 Tax=Tamandua tetradactyla TaxID=48850 RepID=UPI004053ABF7